MSPQDINDDNDENDNQKIMNVRSSGQKYNTFDEKDDPHNNNDNDNDYDNDNDNNNK